MIWAFILVMSYTAYLFIRDGAIPDAHMLTAQTIMFMCLSIIFFILGPKLMKAGLLALLVLIICLIIHAATGGNFPLSLVEIVWMALIFIGSMAIFYLRELEVERKRW